MNNMDKVTAFAFDLDGTLYYGNRAVEGAVKIVASIIKTGYQVFYFTNNSAKTKTSVVEKLSGLGFNSTITNTYTASYACARYLLENNIQSVYVIGSSELINDFEFLGIDVVNAEKASSVVVALDFSFSYEKITGALQAIENGAKLIVANIDASFPNDNRILFPGCGAMVGAIIGATGHEPDFIVGKPNTYMLELLCKDWTLNPSEICVIGDSLESDIEMANRFHCNSILFDDFDRYPNYTAKRIKSYIELTYLLQ